MLVLNAFHERAYFVNWHDGGIKPAKTTKRIMNIFV